MLLHYNTKNDYKSILEQAGISTIPLKPGTKEPMFAGWQSTPPGEQWARVKGDSYNVGALVGKNWLIVDCDDQTAASTIKEYLQALGACWVTVLTPSRKGLHFYIRVENIPPNFTSYNLIPSIGKGEVRGHCNTVTLGSTIDGKAYQVVRGDFETAMQRDPVQWSDLLYLINYKPQAPSAAGESLPVRLLHRDAPKRALDLLERLRGAPKGQPIDKYPTRSEAEQACIVMLILAGWDYLEILESFEQWQPGHYADCGRSRERYFSQSHRKATQFISQDQQREQIASAYQNITQADMLDCDRLVLLGMLAISYQHATSEIRASIRDLSLYSGYSVAYVHKSLKRLLESEHITELGQATCQAGKLYRVNGGVCKSEHITEVCCSTGFKTGKSSRRTGLDAIVLELLRDGGERKISDISAITGKHRTTILRTLKKLKDRDLVVSIDRPGRASLWSMVGGGGTVDAENESLANAIRKQRAEWQETHAAYIVYTEQTCIGECEPGGHNVDFGGGVVDVSSSPNYPDYYCPVCGGDDILHDYGGKAICKDCEYRELFRARRREIEREKVDAWKARELDDWSKARASVTVGNRSSAHDHPADQVTRSPWPGMTDARLRYFCAFSKDTAIGKKARAERERRMEP